MTSRFKIENDYLYFNKKVVADVGLLYELDFYDNDELEESLFDVLDNLILVYPNGEEPIEVDNLTSEEKIIILQYQIIREKE